MTREEIIQRIVGYCIDEAKVDCTGFWQIFSYAKHRFGAQHNSDVETTTLDIVRALLKRKFKAGDLQKEAPYFMEWPAQDIDQTLADILAKWRHLGREPKPGDICWFKLEV